MALAPVKYVRPPLYKKQHDAFFNAARISLVEASTKSGKTFAAMIWLFEQALLSKLKNRAFHWVAPIYPQASIAYRRLCAAIPENLRTINETKLSITLPNGNIIWFKSGEKPDNLYGDDVEAVVIDEASRMREESFFAIRSTLTKTRGPIRAVGNVRGRKNWFFRLCRRAESGEKDMAYAKITADDAVHAGILVKEEIEDAKRLLPDSVFQELYMAVPTEDGSNPFGMKYIAAAVSEMSIAAPVCFGLDLARAVDWTVGIGLDQDCSVSAFERFQKPWEEAYTAIHTMTDPSKSPVLVDSTGVGDAIVSRLQKDRPNRYEGYKFTTKTKQTLMEGLAVAIQTGRVKFPDGPIRMELENFEFEYTGRDGHSTGVRYSAPEGFHDDCVVALALAVSMHTNKITNKERKVFNNFS